jgi:hypothetical protein
VQVDVPGVDLSEVHERGDFAVTDLPQTWREEVEAGITADGLDDAQRILEELSAQAEDQQPARRNTA